MSARILELTQRFPPALGGVEQHVAHLAVALRAEGFHVEVATTDLARDRPFARLPPPYPEEGVPVRRHRAIRTAPLPHGLGIVAPGMFPDALRAEVEVLHAHAFGFFPTWAAAVVQRLGRARLVITPHSDVGTGTSGSQLYGRFVALGTLTHADRVIAQSSQEATRLGRLGVDPARLVQIPTPIDLGEFRDLPSSARPRPRPVVLFVGRLYTAQKGLDVLVRAVASLEAAARPELRMVGEDWGSRAPLEELAARLGVRDRLVFTGALSRREVLREYASADLFVLPSRFDSVPVVILEAMAAGLPVVATRVGGVPEMVEDEKTGILVPPGDVPRLSEALRDLLMNPTRRARLGESGRNAVTAFSWDRLGPRYAALFSELALGR